MGTESLTGGGGGTDGGTGVIDRPGWVKDNDNDRNVWLYIQDRDANAPFIYSDDVLGSIDFDDTPGQIWVLKRKSTGIGWHQSLYSDYELDKAAAWVEALE